MFLKVKYVVISLILIHVHLILCVLNITCTVCTCTVCTCVRVYVCSVQRVHTTIFSVLFHAHVA